MNKRLIFFLLIGLGFCFLGIFLSGCGQTTQSDSSSSTSSIGIISIRGTLTSGQIQSSAITAKSGVKILAASASAVPDYTVVAIGKNNGGVFFADSKTDNSGNFTIGNLPSGESFYIEILDSNNRLTAPVAFGDSSGKAIMAVTPEAQTTIEVGDIVFDSDKSAAAAATEPTSFLDNNAQARVKDGEITVPVGAGNFGKGTGEAKYSGAYNSQKIDGDEDGLPNIFDADLNGDGIVNEIDGLYTMESFTKTDKDKSSSVYVFSNLKIEYSNSNSFDYEQYLHLAMGITPDPDKVNSISSVNLVSGPSCISKMKVFSVPGTTLEAIPAPGTLWSNTSYKLYKSENGGATAGWAISVNGVEPYINGSGDLKAGDIFKFKITYTDGSSEYITKMLNFIFTDIPRLVEYSFNNGSAWNTPPAILEGGTSTMTTASTSEITLKWSRPKDENGAEIIGADYTFEYSPAKGVSDVPEITKIENDSGSSTYLEATQDFAGLLDPGSSFLIGICIRSVANDNAAQNIWFNRDGSW